MITINQAPLANKILLDANNTLISITSTNGAGHYFRALIYVNDILFDEQGWSRKDNYTAEKDLKNLYKAYFETVFNPTFTAGLTEQTSLIKKITIEIKEINIVTRTQVDSIIFPDFYCMFNSKPCVFTDATEAQFLGIPQYISAIPNDGKITVPFMVNAISDDINITVINDAGTILDTITETAVTGKKVYLYNLDLASETIADSVLFLNLIITVGATSISKIYRLYRYAYTNFPVKQLVYQNNFGYYLYAYVDGQLTIDNNLEIKSYEQLDYTDKVYEINEEFTYTINTGSLVEKEKQIIRQIANSLDSKLFYSNKWINLVPQTKKIAEFKDRNHSYSENLIFKVKEDGVSNLNEPFPTEKYIFISGISDILFENMKVNFTASFDLTSLTAEFSNDGVTWENPFPITGVDSPKDISNMFDNGVLGIYPRYVTLYVRLIDDNNGVLTYSNVYFKDIIAKITTDVADASVTSFLSVLVPKKLKVVLTGVGINNFTVNFNPDTSGVLPPFETHTFVGESEYIFSETISPTIGGVISSNALQNPFNFDNVAQFILINP